METFVVSACTSEGRKIMVGGICQADAGQAQEAWRRYLAAYPFVGRKDFVAVDHDLFHYLMQGPWQGALALGASVDKAGVVLRSGGIIGDPSEDGQDAEGNMEQLSSGLYLLAYPGRFGAVFEGSMQTAQLLDRSFSALLEMDNDHSAPQAESLLRQYAGTFLFIADVSGPGEYCNAAAAEGERRRDRKEKK